MEHLAELGFEKFEDIVGRADLLVRDEQVSNWKIKNLDLSPLMFMPEEAKTNALRWQDPQDHKIDKILDRELISKATPALEHGEKVTIQSPIRNTDRTTGAMLSGQVTKRYGAEGLPDGTIRCRFSGSAGQSFGAFLSPGMEFHLEGDTNDYLGKGLSGGRIIVVPPTGSTFEPHKNIIIGNTVLYGATRGEAYISGMAGERFAVRNSGATAVVEGVGDHGCEYMTGGRVVVLGEIGRNFAAGMSGGIAYVLNETGNVDYYCNMGMVELSLLEEQSDVRELTELISKHYEHTGSQIAEKILSEMHLYIPKFLKIIPFEYKKVLQEQKLAELNKRISEVEKDVEHISSD
jgi:glutamate synthase (NADPH/NADH) large chain